MPPVRAPMTAKGLKTERTHEENQERAYIAASRRSDRSLEARIESARRASEIHKKRTGRALRVTEQDVINEEMYEEEDDDLQSQYRRLQAHLGNSADLFNGRLNAWVLSHYGTRQMAMAAQNGIPFNPNMGNMFPPSTPFFAYQPQPQSPNGAISPGLTQRNQSYRQSPYPQPHRGHDGRSHSISSLPEHLTQPGMTENSADPQMLHDQRRHSMAAQAGDHSIPGTPQPLGNMGRPPLSRSNSGMQPGHLGHPAYFADQQFQGAMTAQFQYGGFPTGMSSYDPMAGQMASPISPLTTSLPVEAQQVIGTSFDPQSQYTQMIMNMSHGQPVPAGIYSYRPNLGSSTTLKSPADGINQTLSPNPAVSMPGRIDTNVEDLNTPTLTSGSISSVEGMHPQFPTSESFEPNLGLGMSFDKTPGDTNAGNTPDGFFDWVDPATTE